MTTKLTTTGPDVAKAIGRHEDFCTHGALTGARVDGLGPWDSGRLAGEDLERFREDRAGITYVVRSYATPIAWVANGHAHRVTQRFSVTTSKHQGQCYLLTNGG